MPGAVKLHGPDGLTVKQQAFIHHFLADPRRNATEAAIKAGYSQASASEIASHDLLRHPAVKKAIEEGLEREYSRLRLSPQKILTDLEEARVKALEAQQYAPAVRASELQGKHLRMWRDVVEHEGQSPAAQVAIIISDEGNRQAIADLERRLSGLDDAGVIEGELASPKGLESGDSPPREEAEGS